MVIYGIVFSVLPGYGLGWVGDLAVGIPQGGGATQLKSASILTPILPAPWYPLQGLKNTPKNYDPHPL